MAPLLFYMSAAVLLAQSTVAFNCSKAPIYVDIHKRAVHGSNVFQYGSFIGVGNYAQNQSLWPSLSKNHTSFASLNYCNNDTTLRDCSTSTGGFFDQSQSSTFEELKNFQSLDTDSNSTFTAIYARDDLHLYTHYFETDGASATNVTNTTIAVAQDGSIIPGIVGLGLSSTLLQDLVAQNVIGGKTYSLYIGQGYDRAQGAVNGSNVFGGYDSGRFTGPVHTYQMTPNQGESPLRIRVKDIVITDNANPNSNISLFDTQKFSDTTTKDFVAEITTDQFPLSLPYDVTQNFIKQMNAKEDNTWGDNSLALPSAFSGSLSIVLDDGFTVTIPPEVFVNASNITPVQNRTKDSTTPFYLSAAFLSQVYLMIDYESYQFHLAEAVQKNNAVMPVTFCPKAIPVAYERPNAGSWARQGLVGAVVGGVLGGMGIAICAYCFVLGCRRRRAEKRLEREMEHGRKEAKMAQMEVEDVPEFDPPPKSATPFFWKKR